MTNYRMDRKVQFYLTFFCLVYFNISIAQYTKIFDFSGPDGESPYNTSLIYDGNYLYGLTQFGTTIGGTGVGIMFKIKPDGADYSKLFDFNSHAIGFFPCGSLLEIGDTLYATATMGGNNFMGTLYKIHKNGSAPQKIFDFSASNGGTPISSLSSDGNYLYGVATYSGSGGCGTIFKIKRDGSDFTKLHDFSHLVTGCNPRGSLVYDGGFLYGMSWSHGSKGYIYKLKTDGTAFSRVGIKGDGANPLGSPVYDGVSLYGATTNGGIVDMGTIFKVNPDGSNYSKLYDFTGANGNEPIGSLYVVGNELYGMTTSGGTFDMGVMFKIKSDGTGFTKLMDFNGSETGSNPHGSFVTDGNYIYGMTTKGGTNDKGTIFKYLINPSLLGVNEELTEYKIDIYPNPLSDRMTIESTFHFNEATVSIYNALGEQIETHHKITGRTIPISLGNFSEGIYYIQLTQAGKTFMSKKVIKLSDVK